MPVFAHTFLTVLKEDDLSPSQELGSDIECYFDRLPFELIAYIFELGQPLQPSTAVFDTLEFGKILNQHESPQAFPFVLGSVCRKWKDIAWATPCLWSVLVLQLPFVPARSLRGWLDRSRGHSLYIQIGLMDLQLASGKIFTPILEILGTGSHLSRCRTLQVHLPTHLIRRLLPLHQPTAAMDVLLIYPLDYSGSGHLDNYKSVSNSIGGDVQGPSPTVFTIAALCPFDFGIAWGNMMHFKGTLISMQDVIQILQQSPQMLSFEVEAVVDQPASVSHVTHPSLISMSARNVALNFLDYLTLPALQELDSPLCSDGQFRSLHSFMLRSGCALSTLTLGGYRIKDDIIVLLAMQPSLMSLSLQAVFDTHLSEFFFQALGQTDRIGDQVAEQRFLPILRDLTITTYGTSILNHLPLVWVHRPQSEDRRFYRPLLEVNIGIRHFEHSESVNGDDEDAILDLQRVQTLFKFSPYANCQGPHFSIMEDFDSHLRDDVLLRSYRHHATELFADLDGMQKLVLFGDQLVLERRWGELIDLKRLY